jgi:hypothetical protein
MPYERGKFVKPGTASTGPKIGKDVGKHGAGGMSDAHVKKHGAPQAPHGATSQEKHVTETHPGVTQPHPVTGVHAHHVHHTGEHASGGPQYTSHTHHDDGTVETKQNQTHDEMVADREQAFPQEGGMPANEPSGGDNDQYADMMSGIGGSEGSQV